jgi:hypothetical protein
LRYVFFDKDGVPYVRIAIGGDVVEREATDADREVGEKENAAEDAQLAAAEAETKERLEHAAANEKERTEGKPPPDATDQPSQKQIEREFDQKLESELEDRNGHKKHKKSAE